jgi:ribosomal protein S18 acetylase RimI-like enzyme
MKYFQEDDLSEEDFIALARRVWPDDFDPTQVKKALEKTINITARKDDQLVGCVRVLTDGYFFGTIPEILVDPEHQGEGVGEHLMELAWDTSPTSLYFGAQPGNETFFEKLGFGRGVQSFWRKKPRPKRSTHQ